MVPAPAKPNPPAPYLSAFTGNGSFKLFSFAYLSNCLSVRPLIYLFLLCKKGFFGKVSSLAVAGAEDGFCCAAIACFWSGVIFFHCCLEILLGRIWAGGGVLAAGGGPRVGSTLIGWEFLPLRDPPRPAPPGPTPPPKSGDTIGSPRCGLVVPKEPKWLSGSYCPASASLLRRLSSICFKLRRAIV